jgi:hypothetical protein
MEGTPQLLKIAGCENTRRQADVIFVHGLDSDARTTWHSPEKPSAPSSLNFGVEPLQFHAGVFDVAWPVDAALVGIGFLGPQSDFGLQFCPLTEAAIVQTLAREAAPFACGNMQPTAVLRRVAAGKAVEVRSNPLRGKRCIACA